MILYENINFANSIKASDYVFTAVENFMHDWSLRAQRHISGVVLVNHPKHKRVIAEATSLDEIKVWLDLHIPNTNILYEMRYGELIKRSKI